MLLSMEGGVMDTVTRDRGRDLVDGRAGDGLGRLPAANCLPRAWPSFPFQAPQPHGRSDHDDGDHDIIRRWDNAAWRMRLGEGRGERESINGTWGTYTSLAHGGDSRDLLSPSCGWAEPADVVASRHRVIQVSRPQKRLAEDDGSSVVLRSPVLATAPPPSSPVQPGNASLKMMAPTFS